MFLLSNHPVACFELSACSRLRNGQCGMRDWLSSIHLLLLFGPIHMHIHIHLSRHAALCLPFALAISISIHCNSSVLSPLLHLLLQQLLHIALSIFFFVAITHSERGAKRGRGIGIGREQSHLAAGNLSSRFGLHLLLLLLLLLRLIIFRPTTVPLLPYR